MMHALDYVHPLGQVTFYMRDYSGKEVEVHARAPNEVCLYDALCVIPLRPYPVLAPPPSKYDKKEKKIAYEESSRNILGAWSTSQYIASRELEKKANVTRRLDTRAQYYNLNYTINWIYRDYITLDALHELLGDNITFPAFESEIRTQWKKHVTDYMTSVDTLKRRCEAMLEEVERPVKKARVE